jgi:hypothetical protein
LGRRLHWEALRRGLGRAQWILVVADGAPWIWNVAADRWANAVELLDFWHASEHLWELGRALYGEAGAKKWVENRLHELRHGEEEKFLAKISRLKTRRGKVGKTIREQKHYLPTEAGRTAAARPNPLAAASKTASSAAGNRAKANHAGAFVWADSQSADFTSAGSNVFRVRCRGGVQFSSGTAGTDQSVTWGPGSGAWSFSSDRNLKERLLPVDAQSVLEKVRRLRLAEWSYKGYEERHIGPMAQDFHAAFPLNNNDKDAQ